MALAEKSDVANENQPKRGRGRPKGSKTRRVTAVSPLMIHELCPCCYRHTTNDAVILDRDRTQWFNYGIEPHNAIRKDLVRCKGCNGPYWRPQAIYMTPEEKRAKGLL